MDEDEGAMVKRKLEVLRSFCLALLHFKYCHAERRV